MMSRTGRTSRRQGLALVEVLVAVVILFLGLTAVLRVYSGAVRALEASERTLVGVLLIQSALEVSPVVAARDMPTLMPSGDGLVGGGYAVQAVRGGPVPGSGVGLTEFRLESRKAGVPEATLQVVTHVVPGLP